MHVLCTPYRCKIRSTYKVHKICAYIHIKARSRLRSTGATAAHMRLPILQFRRQRTTHRLAYRILGTVLWREHTRLLSVPYLAWRPEAWNLALQPKLSCMGGSSPLHPTNPANPVPTRRAIPRVPTQIQPMPTTCMSGRCDCGWTLTGAETNDQMEHQAPARLTRAAKWLASNSRLLTSCMYHCAGRFGLSSV